MITDTKNGQTNYCPMCEDQARRIEELERQNKRLADVAEKLADDVSGFNVSGVYYSEFKENQKLIRDVYDAIESTPSHSAAWEWNRHVEWMKNLPVVAYGDRLGSHWQQAYCVPDTGVPSWMEPMIKLVAIPELKEVKE